MEFLLTILEGITHNMSVPHEKKEIQSLSSPIGWTISPIFNSISLSQSFRHMWQMAHCAEQSCPFPEGLPAWPYPLYPWAPRVRLSGAQCLSAEWGSVSMNQENTEAAHTTINSWHMGASTWSDSGQKSWGHSSSLHQCGLGLCLLLT